MTDDTKSEHDSLVSHALNNLTVNELLGEYANLLIEVKRLRDRRDAALRALTEIAAYPLNSTKQIAQDALEAEKRAYE